MEIKKIPVGTKIVLSNWLLEQGYGYENNLYAIIIGYDYDDWVLLRGITRNDGCECFTIVCEESKLYKTFFDENGNKIDIEPVNKYNEMYLELCDIKVYNNNKLSKECIRSLL